MVCAPVVHNIVSRLKRALARNARSKPGAGPGIVGAFPKRIAYLCRQIHCPALNYLEYGSQAFYKVKPYHCGGHFSLCFKAGGESAAAEIAEVGIVPGGVIHYSLLIFFCHIVPRLHNGIAVFVFCRAACVKAAGSRIYKVNKAVRIFCMTLKVIARYSLYRFSVPAGSDIGKHLRTVGEQLHKQHTETVQNIVFGCQYIRLSRSVPIKRSIKQRFGEIAVRIEVRPLALTLKACGYRVVTYSLFLAALGEVFITVHKVFYDNAHLNGKFPVLFFLLVCSLQIFGVFIKTHLAVFFRPFKSLFVLFLIINALGHSADDFHFVYRFNAHTEVILDKVRVNYRAAYAHCDRAYL